MLESDKVQSSEQGKAKLRDKLKETKLTIEELANQATVGQDTVKRLLGTKECPNGVERWGVKNIAKALNIKPTDIVDPKDWYPQYELPAEFKSVIQEKIKKFCGRQFVFDEIDQFISEKTKGYFTVIGDAGMGKTALAAKLISDRQYPCYFNILAERRNRPDQFLTSIREQLIQRYQLQNAAADDLPTLLEKASQKLTTGEQLIIVVDALDEVEQEPGDNLLYLPTTLPDRVYFVLTRRPYILEKKRLLSPGVPFHELDLRKEEYMKLSYIDIKDYIRLFLEYPEHQENLQKWIQDRNTTTEAFVEQVAVKSQNNFMYLRYVLPAIAQGKYYDLELRQLPDGLQEYYQTHWVRMKMDQYPQKMMVILLFILVEIGTPIPCEMMAKIAEQDEAEVGKVLDEWFFDYLTVQEIQGESCYSIYHASFLDFLKGKRELKATRKLFDEVNGRITDYLEGEMAEDDEEGEDEE